MFLPPSGVLSLCRYSDRRRAVRRLPHVVSRSPHAALRTRGPMSSPITSVAGLSSGIQWQRHGRSDHAAGAVAHARSDHDPADQRPGANGARGRATATSSRAPRRCVELERCVGVQLVSSECRQQSHRGSHAAVSNGQRGRDSRRPTKSKSTTSRAPKSLAARRWPIRRRRSICRAMCSSAVAAHGDRQRLANSIRDKINALNTRYEPVARERVDPHGVVGHQPSRADERHDRLGRHRARRERRQHVLSSLGLASDTLVANTMGGNARSYGFTTATTSLGQALGADDACRGRVSGERHGVDVDLSQDSLTTIAAKINSRGRREHRDGELRDRSMARRLAPDRQRHRHRESGRHAARQHAESPAARFSRERSQRRHAARCADRRAAQDRRHPVDAQHQRRCPTHSPASR